MNIASRVTRVFVAALLVVVSAQATAKGNFSAINSSRKVMAYSNDDSSTIKLRKNGKRTNITGLILALTISLAIYGIIDISFVWVQTGMIIVFIYSAFGIEEDKLTDMQNELKNE